MRAQVGNEPPVIAEFLRDFGHSLQQLAADIALAFSSADAQALVAAAHKLKSAARAVGALPLGACCAELEARGSETPLAALAAVHAQLITEMDLVQRLLAATLAAPTKDPPQ